MSDITVTRVIGTGDPFDVLLIIPLVHQWGVARACATEQEEPCTAPLSRIVTLAEPGLTDDRGRNSCELGYCEPHFGTFWARLKTEEPT